MSHDSIIIDVPPLNKRLFKKVSALLLRPVYGGKWYPWNFILLGISIGLVLIFLLYYLETQYQISSLTICLSFVIGYLTCLLIIINTARRMTNHMYNNQPILYQGYRLILDENFMTIELGDSKTIKPLKQKIHLNIENHIILSILGVGFIWLPKDLVEKHPQKDRIKQLLSI